MRVGFSIVAGLIAAAITALGFMFADHEFVSRDHASWVFVPSDHTTTITVGDDDAAADSACNDDPSRPCADAAELAALAEALDATGETWRIEVLVFRSGVTANGETAEGAPSPTMLNTAFVYLGDTDSLQPVVGRAPHAATEIAINASYAEALGVGLGDVVTLEDKDWDDGTDRPLEMTVVGILASGSHFAPYVPAAVDLWTSQPAVVVGEEALPDLLNDRPIVGFAMVRWDGTREVVTDIEPNADVDPGHQAVTDNWNYEAQWLAAAAAALVGACAWLGLAGLRRGLKWSPRLLAWVFAPPLIGAVVATASAAAHAQWVHTIAPYSLVRPPWPPMPWTLTAMATGLAITIACEAANQTRRRHAA